MRNKIIVLFIILCFPVFASALTLCEKSEAYKAYENLSPEEKKNYIAPMYCKEETKKGINNNLRNKVGSSITDSRYNANEHGLVTSPKNQYNVGACWAFSAVSLVESNALKNKYKAYDLSEAHVLYGVVAAGYNDAAGKVGKYNTDSISGGTLLYAPSYFYNNAGMVLESQMQYPQNETKINSSDYPKGTNIYTIGDFEILNDTEYGACTTSEITAIKEKIIANGSAGGSMYMNNSLFKDQTTKDYYLAKTTNSPLPNHAITITGWDDSISKSNFNGASRDGAWIIKNSWGSTWSKDGYFYISYDDNFICKASYSYSGVSTVNFENSYHSADMLGITTLQFNGGISYSSKFTKSTTGTEKIDRVSFVVSDNSTYKVYLSKDNILADETNWIKLGEGHTVNKGIKTIDLDTGEVIGDTFTIIVMYTADSGSKTSLITMCDLIEDTASMEYSVETNYIGTGTGWLDMSSIPMRDQNNNNINVKCEPNIFVYTNKIEGEPPEETLINVIDNTNASVDEDLVNIKITRTDTLTTTKLLSKISPEKEYEIFDASNNKVTDTTKPLGTGHKIVVGTKTFYIILYGDTNGDGKITALDYIEIRKHMMGTPITNEYKKKAADMDNNSKITALDYIAVRKILMA